jgi:hypothetical protein
MPQDRKVAASRVMVLLAALVAAGIPLVAYLWETLNQTLAGHIQPHRLGLSLPLAAAFAALLWAGARGFARLAAPPPDRAREEPDVSGTLFLVALLLMLIFGGWLTGYALLLER